MRLPAPKGLRVQAVVDAEGTLREPVVLSGGLPGAVWEALEALRGWRFEPARQGEQAVAAFQELTLNPPEGKSLPELAVLSGKPAEVESLLRAGKWKEAGKRTRKLWTAELDGDQPAQQRLAALLALRALADAGAGETEAAICRWQAAQHLDERLYDADLSPYGTAGRLLDANRWGAARVELVSGRILQPVMTRRPALSYPDKLRKKALQGIVVLTGIVDERGALRQPTVVRMYSITGEEMGEIESATFAEPLNPRKLMAVNALDSFCDWHFRPATLNGGAPVAFQEIFAVPFSTGSQPIYGRFPDGVIPVRTGMPDRTGGTFQSTRPEAIQNARDGRPPD
jgi:outer membrane biosynthesis protein TonB